MNPDRAPGVCELFEVQARRSPAATAVVAPGGEALTYAELARRTHRLARRLRALGLPPEALVAVALQRSAESIVAFLATLEAGAVYVPIDPALPAARRRALAEQAGAAAVITDPASWGGEEPPSCGLLLLEEAVPVEERGTASDAPGGESPAVEILPASLAYVLFTSGSTGAPKAVALTHESLRRLIAWQCSQQPEPLRTLQFAPSSFDVWLQEVLSTLCAGGTLHVVDEALRRDPLGLLGYLREEAIERLFLPYVALRQLAEAVETCAAPPGSLRWIITAGEQLKATPTLRRMLERLPGVRLDNHYGPTETHLATSFVLPAAPGEWDDLPAIGRPIAETTVHVLDGRMRPVAEGRPGELFIGGSGPARGYLGDPRLTAERFVPDPFERRPGARLYRTGDLARRGGADGLFFEGRRDRQLKIRGVRVEPAEVEAALDACPGVRLAAVDARSSAAGIDRLAAYVVPQPGRTLTAELLRSRLAGRLPAPMVPTVFFFLDGLPLTASGKVDRGRLARIGSRGGACPEEAPGGDSSLRGRLARVWCRVLELDEIALDEDFFDVGGDSLLATRLVAEASAELAREVPLSTLLDECTIDGMADRLEALPRAAGASAGAFHTVALRADSSTPGVAATPLVLVHPLGGEVLCYRQLVRRLRRPRPVHGLVWTPSAPPGPALAEVAAGHLAQIEHLVAAGPVALAGWSYGGVVAYEMASQLRSKGGEVAVLALIDANPSVDPTSGRGIDDQPVLERLSAFLDELSEAGPAGPREPLEEIFERRFGGGILGGDLPATVSLEHLRRYLETTLLSLEAAVGYRAPHYPEKVHLLRASGSAAPIRRACEAALAALTGGRLEVYDVPGDHHGLLREPHATTTAQALESILEGASAPVPSELRSKEV